MKSVKKVTFRSPINLERSMSPNLERLVDDTESTMELYTQDGTLDHGVGDIEWDIPELEMTESIGVWWDDDKNLTDYDGVMCMPIQARRLLELVGIKCEDWLGPEEEDEKGVTVTEVKAA